MIYRHHWVHSRFFRHRSMIVQFTTVQLGSTITGTHPGALLSQNISLPSNPSSLDKRKRAHDFQSDLPKYISLKDLETAVFLCDEFRTMITASRIRRALAAKGWSKKAARQHAKERNADLRELYLHNLSDFRSSHLVYVDESGCDKRTGFRRTC